MLYGYPVAATQENWLHRSLVSAVETVHGLVSRGARMPAWPKVLPEDRRKRLKGFTRLRDSLAAYAVALRGLDSAARQGLLDAMHAQNEVADLLAGTCDCCTLEGLPEQSRTPVEALFTLGFEMLTPTGIRDAHYRALYSARTDHLCPFCGLEYFEEPGTPREPLDHYLARSIYPFAAANLRNLIPMGPRCNTSYKRDRDVLRKADGTRRRAFDPYSNDGSALNLDESVPFEGANRAYPRWVIHFEGHAEAVAAWDEIFCVRDRYSSVLDETFPRLLKEFGRWAREGQTQGSDRAQLIRALSTFEENMREIGLSDRAFLKAAVIRMLRLRCEAGDDRLADVLAGAIPPPQRMPQPGLAVPTPRTGTGG